MRHSMKLGTDIIEIHRIQRAIEKSDTFLKRVFTPAEIEYCESKKKGRFQSYAGMYAAKEAVLKALGTGLRYGSWQDIEITHTPLGAPVVTLRSTFLDIMKQQQLQDIIISISHCERYAMSTVIIKGE